MKIRYYGPVGLPTGYGDAANEFCMSMVEVGLDVEILTAAGQLHRRYLPLAPHIRSDANPPSDNPDVVIVHTLPLSCAKTLELTRVRETCPNAKLVAYTTWEGHSSAPRELVEALWAFHEVWVPSRTTAQSLIMGGMKNVRVIPHAYDGRPFVSKEPPRVRPYRFYAIGAWSARKNHEDVVRAYLRAFDKGDNVELHIHASGANEHAAQLVAIAATGKQPSDLPPIFFTTGRLTDEQIAEMHQVNDCFVSASRGESWNLPAFDAMVAGSHIIATADLGHDDFLDYTSSWRILAKPAPATGEIVMKEVDGKRVGHYVGGDCLNVKATWMEPDIAELAGLMAGAAVGRPTLVQATSDENLEYEFSRLAVGIDIEYALMGPPAAVL